MIGLVIAIVVTVLLSLYIKIQSWHRQPIQCTEKQSYRSELVVSQLSAIPCHMRIARIRYSLESEEETELLNGAPGTDEHSSDDAEYHCVDDILPSCMVHPIEETRRPAIAEHASLGCCTIDEMAAVSSVYCSFPLEETLSKTTNNTNDQLVVQLSLLNTMYAHQHPISETTRSSLVTGRATTLGADFHRLVDCKNMCHV